ncbi:MAG TPA: hypothetical protein VLU73_05475 [Methylococcaceae bacterium]|nr:hypothetical protein [Methylococcaceae bacterium]
MASVLALFSADALENIRYGGADASDTAVKAAARAALADEFIERLPEGYRTFLGERGVRLSGGQRHRSGHPQASSRTRRYCSSMKPPARWMPKASVWCRRRWNT